MVLDSLGYPIVNTESFTCKAPTETSNVKCFFPVTQMKYVLIKCKLMNLPNILNINVAHEL